HRRVTEGAEAWERQEEREATVERVVRLGEWEERVEMADQGHPGSRRLRQVGLECPAETVGRGSMAVVPAEMEDPVRRAKPLAAQVEKEAAGAWPLARTEPTAVGWADLAGRVARAAV